MNFSDPRTNVLQMGVREGMHIADLGAGSGHYTLALAAAIGREGKVYAVDVQEEVLKHFHDTARRAGFRNIETVWGNVEKLGGTKLRNNAMDAVVCANLLFQVEHKESLVKEILRILKPGGKILVVDWSGSYGGMGPHPGHVVTEHKAEELFIHEGVHKVKNFRAGAHHYGVVFEKPQ